MLTTINHQDTKDRDNKQIEAGLTPEHRAIVQRLDQVLDAYKEKKVYLEKKRSASFFKRIMKKLFS